MEAEYQKIQILGCSIFKNVMERLLFKSVLISWFLSGDGIVEMGSLLFFVDMY